MRTLSAQVAGRLRQRAARAALLQVCGLAAISFALGMWLVPVGVAAAGVSLLVLAALQE